MRRYLISFLFLLAAVAKTHEECVSRDYDLGGTVCVCDSQQCDTIPRPEKLDSSQFYIYTSNKAGLRFNQEVGAFAEEIVANYQIEIDSEKKYQSILGFGGAFTDATGINIASLDDDLQEKLLESYFGENGIEYSLCRVPIGGTDFSTHGYSYDDGDVDLELNNFALAEEDHQYKIPYILQASELTNGNLQFFASAWTAPKWMKTNGEFDGHGYIIEDMYQTWADYFVKFLDSYEEEGISFWGITTGNEPSIPSSKINCVGWNSTEMGKWISNNLGPAIVNSNHQDINIMILDDNRQFLPDFIDTALEDETADQYIAGIAFHWYINTLIPASVLTTTHDHFPEKFILSTEACNFAPVTLGSWERGESYSADIIEDVQNWAGGWVDWNMVLDLTGGPTYIDNFVDSPIIVNATAGEFYKQPTFYHLGHFSKFVPRGSVRIEANTNLENDVLVAAFQTPENATVVVILNREEELVSVDLVDGVRGTAQLELSERSITTILYW